MKATFTKLQTFLAGKKSYIISIAWLAYGFYHVNGFHNWRAIVPYVMASGFGASIRAAIAKAALPPVTVQPTVVQPTIIDPTAGQ